MNMTETFPFWVHPVRDGVYEVDCKNWEKRYSLFKRGAWHMTAHSPTVASWSTLQTPMLITGWRGISKEN